MTWETVLLDRDGAIATVTLNRPDHLNGITGTMMRELHEALHEVADDGTVAVAILTGAGRAFCPGADLAHYRSGGREEPLRDEYFDIPVLLHEMAPVTIAAINGACAGAGLGWACACDLRYVARSAKLNTAFLDVAVAGDMGLPWTLPRLVGAGTARELSMLPRKLTGGEAAAIGLVNAAFDDDALIGEVRRRAERLAAAAPLARRSMKAHYVEAERSGFAEFVALETARHRTITASADTKEAFAAFLDKRPPRFQGR